MSNTNSKNNIDFLLSVGAISQTAADRHLEELKTSWDELNDSDFKIIEEKSKTTKKFLEDEKHKIDYFHKTLLEHKDKLSLTHMFMYKFGE